MSDTLSSPRAVPWWAVPGVDSTWWTDPAITTPPAAGDSDTADDDVVVLVGPDGHATGTAARADVHDDGTPLHLAFSCWVTRADGHVLMTRRALGKRTWPGVWTNSFCGHPRPGESYAEAVHRYAAHELGLTLSTLDPVIPAFRYRAVDASGVGENEICPVFTAVVDGEPVPNPDEVMDHRWVPAAEVADVVAAAPWVVSPRMVEQVRDHGAVPVAGAVALPPPATPSCQVW